MTKKSNPFSPENRIMMESSLRAGLSLARIDLDIVEDFHDQTAKHFQRALKALKTRNDSRPNSYWDEDAGDGTTRGDQASEERFQLEALAQMNNRFGILGVFGAFERLLLRIHQDMMHQNLVHQQFKRD